MFSLFKLNSALFFAVFFICVCVSHADENINRLPDCNMEQDSPGLILVSTLDGNVAALSAKGRLVWQLETGSLLLSNIHKLELTNNGQWIRIIPSLSGSLYKFDGSNIDAIPLTADNLLTSSFKYSDDIIMSGGKEVRNYAVDMASGRKLYECSIDGCKNNTEIDKIEHIVIIERNSYVVRAIEPRTGTERWNFSIAAHNIRVPHASCINVDTALVDYKIKAVLPDGHIMVTSETTLHDPWDYKFQTPIVGVWKWDGRELNKVDLFEPPLDPSDSNAPRPAIYVGMHNKQLYVFESDRMKEALNFKTYPASTVINSKSITRIPWKPISATNNALVPVDDPDGSTALSVLYSSEYVNGNGFYFYTPADLAESNSLICDNQTVAEIEMEKPAEENDVIITVWFWWKEIVVISITTAILINIMFSNFGNLVYVRSLPIQSNSQDNKLEKEPPLLPVHNRTISESGNSYDSRYLTDFEPISCLGKGGFGIVFHVRKKVDDCHYALKRITLPTEDKARERVMREVKALAKLDHKHIVRYYNAWIETPPIEWQQEQDKQLLSEELSFFSTRLSQLASLQKNMSVSIDILNVQTGEESLLSLGDAKLSSNACDDSFIVFDSGTGSLSTEKKQNNSCYELEDTALISHTDRKINWHKPGRRHHSLDITSQGNVIANKSPPAFLYIQMQLCQKESLKDWLQNNHRRDKTEILNIFKQILDAVEYVHLRGLIHRDLKPSNIFFSVDGEVKIGDFGLVTTVQDAPTFSSIKFASPLLNSGYTKAVGTKLYMSPEQFKGEKYNYKVDIYSLGVILFELLIPFSTDMERVMNLTNLCKKNFPQDFPEEHEKERGLLNIMMADDPKDRPTTFGIRASPPFLHEDAVSKHDWHFELPLTKRD